MADLPAPTGEERRASLVEILAGALSGWGIENVAPDGFGTTNRVAEWPEDERDFYRAAMTDLMTTNTDIQGIRRRKVAEAVLSLLESGTAGVRAVTDGAALEEVERLHARFAVRDAEVRTLTGELEAERARRYEPGPVVLRAVFGDGWVVRCLACEAGTLVGIPSKDAAVARAERHVHVYPDGGGCISTPGAWPTTTREEPTP